AFPVGFWRNFLPHLPFGLFRGRKQFRAKLLHPPQPLLVESPPRETVTHTAPIAGPHPIGCINLRRDPVAPEAADASPAPPSAPAAPARTPCDQTPDAPSETRASPPCSARCPSHAAHRALPPARRSPAPSSRPDALDSADTGS